MSPLPDFSSFKRPVFFTGAGLSAESGIPTYRGAGGLWHEYNFEDYACQEAYEQRPNAVWDFHDLRRQKVHECTPNKGHELIAKVCSENKNARVVTQNIDGLHQRSGISSQQIFELHGSLWRIRIDSIEVCEENFEIPLRNRQHQCGEFYRPDIVWFGDVLRPETVQGALEAIRNCDIFISIGTSGVVYPAAQFPLDAKVNQAVLIEVNPQSTPLSHAFDHHMRMPASEALALLVE